VKRYFLILASVEMQCFDWGLSIPLITLMRRLGINLAQLGHEFGSEPHLENIFTFASVFIFIV